MEQQQDLHIVNEVEVMEEEMKDLAGLCGPLSSSSSYCHCHNCSCRPVCLCQDQRLLVLAELVTKTFACLVHLVACSDVTVLTEVLVIEVIKLFCVFGVKDVTRLNMIVEYDVCVIVLAVLVVVLRP